MNCEELKNILTLSLNEDFDLQDKQQKKFQRAKESADFLYKNSKDFSDWLKFDDDELAFLLSQQVPYSNEVLNVAMSRHKTKEIIDKSKEFSEPIQEDYNNSNIEYDNGDLIDLNVNDFVNKFMITEQSLNTVRKFGDITYYIVLLKEENQFKVMILGNDDGGQYVLNNEFVSDELNDISDYLYNWKQEQISNLDFFNCDDGIY